MTVHRIEHLDQLLQQHIGNATIIDTKTSCLTAPGENFGSIMLKVDIILKNKGNGAQETLHLVGKLIPATEFFQQIFNIQVTFKNEIAFYDTIVPTLQEFQRKQGVDRVIDLFPKLYGARINLDGKSETVDEHAALVLENLKVLGYTNVNRMEGFDLETTKLILKDLATFHAVPLALKLLKPAVFEEKVKPYLKTSVSPPSESPNPILKDILETLGECEQCKSLMPLIKKNVDKVIPAGNREPFSTIIHDDMWVNNIMVKFENGKPVTSRFVDFQALMYSSPAADLLFFLWSSVQKAVLEKNLDDLIKFYHENFIGTLQQLKCDVLPFSYWKFLQEIDAVSKSQFVHVLFMIMVVVCGKRDEVPAPGKKDFTLEGKERAVYFIEEYNRRGWLT